MIFLLEMVLFSPLHLHCGMTFVGKIVGSHCVLWFFGGCSEFVSFLSCIFFFKWLIWPRYDIGEIGLTSWCAEVPFTVKFLFYMGEILQTLLRLLGMETREMWDSLYPAPYQLKFLGWPYSYDSGRTPEITDSITSGVHVRPVSSLGGEGGVYLPSLYIEALRWPAALLFRGTHEKAGLNLNLTTAYGHT